MYDLYQWPPKRQKPDGWFVDIDRSPDHRPSSSRIAIEGYGSVVASAWEVKTDRGERLGVFVIRSHGKFHGVSIFTKEEIDRGTLQQDQ